MKQRIEKQIKVVVALNTLLERARKVDPDVEAIFGDATFHLDAADQIVIHCPNADPVNVARGILQYTGTKVEPFGKTGYALTDYDPQALFELASPPSRQGHAARILREQLDAQKKSAVKSFSVN